MNVIKTQTVRESYRYIQKLLQLYLTQGLPKLVLRYLREFVPFLKKNSHVLYNGNWSEEYKFRIIGMDVVYYSMINYNPWTVGDKIYKYELHFDKVVVDQIDYSIENICLKNGPVLQDAIRDIFINIDSFSALEKYMTKSRIFTNAKLKVKSNGKSLPQVKSLVKKFLRCNDGKIFLDKLETDFLDYNIKKLIKHDYLRKHCICPHTSIAKVLGICCCNLMQRMCGGKWFPPGF